LEEKKRGVNGQKGGRRKEEMLISVLQRHTEAWGGGKECGDQGERKKKEKKKFGRQISINSASGQ